MSQMIKYSLYHPRKIKKQRNRGITSSLHFLSSSGVIVMFLFQSLRTAWNRYALDEKKGTGAKRAEKKVKKITRDGGSKLSEENILFLSLLLRHMRSKYNKPEDGLKNYKLCVYVFQTSTHFSVSFFLFFFRKWQRKPRTKAVKRFCGWGFVFGGIKCLTNKSIEEYL